MKSTGQLTDPYALRPAAPVSSEGYLGSSLDLQAGLRVRELMISACPPEVIHELARMRRAWTTPKAA
jgi:hypothetical protein